ncbi:MAG TPA: lysophospholipid acyltransferase family protein [Malonomonas sp.]
MRFGDRLLVTFAPFLASWAIRFLSWTNRTEILGEEHPRNFWDQGKCLIFCCWHDQLLMMVTAYHGPGAKILISSSKDGELIARTMSFFGLGAVRGSSSRGGRAAFKELLNLSKEPVDLGVTPDGPRGPRHQIKDGVAQLARLSGRPVVPLAFVCSRGHRFKSWDRFLLPYPFGRGVFSYGEPVLYEKGEAIERFRERLSEAMRLNQQRAEARLEEFSVSAV